MRAKSRIFSAVLCGPFGMGVEIKTTFPNSEIESKYQRINGKLEISGVPERTVGETSARIFNSFLSFDAGINGNIKVDINYTDKISNTTRCTLLQTHLDLPIAISILFPYGLNIFAFGDLSLNGDVRKSRGSISIIEQATQHDLIIVPDAALATEYKYIKKRFTKVSRLEKAVKIINSRKFNESINSQPHV